MSSRCASHKSFFLLSVIWMFVRCCKKCLDNTNPATPREENSTNDDETMICPICLMEMFEDFVTLSCKHTFHAKCLRKWYIKCHENRVNEDAEQGSCGNPCPMCRAPCTHDESNTVINYDGYWPTNLVC